MSAKYTTWYYYPLKVLVVISCHLFFRKLRITGIKNVPRKGSLIFAISHQNALLDPLVIHSTAFRNPYFLTRGDIFSNKFVDRFLRGLKMLPIYRIRDGYDSVKMNEPIFEATKDILLKRGVVGIFPEGSHSLKHRIRPLKKGIARIAFGAENASDFNLNLKIVPVGIYYESHYSTKGRTFVSYGKPIQVADFQDAFTENQNHGAEKLISVIRERMKPLTLHFEDKKNYDQNLITYNQKRVYKKNLNDQLRSDQALINSIEKGTPFEDKPDKRNMLLSGLGYSWLILWRIITFIPKSIVGLIVKKTVKDLHFYATMQYAYSIIVYHIFFVIAYFLIRYLVF